MCIDDVFADDDLERFDDHYLEDTLIEVAERVENQLFDEQSVEGTQEMMDAAVECCSNQNFGDQSFDLFDSQQLTEPQSFDIVDYCNDSNVASTPFGSQKTNGSVAFDDDGVSDSQMADAYDEFENERRAIATGKILYFFSKYLTRRVNFDVIAQCGKCV